MSISSLFLSVHNSNKAHYEGTPSMTAATVCTSRQQRPALVNHKTDPCTMREFAYSNLNKGKAIGDNVEGSCPGKRQETSCEEVRVDSKKNSHCNEETFLVSIKLIHIHIL